MSAFCACSSAPPPTPPETPPAAEPEEPTGPVGPEAIETGKDCVVAEAECESNPGVCVTTVKNNCETAVTCQITILALCESSTNKGQAGGKARGTIPSGESDKLQAVADCEGDAITATMVDAASCK